MPGKNASSIYTAIARTVSFCLNSLFSVVTTGYVKSPCRKPLGMFGTEFHMIHMNALVYMCIGQCLITSMYQLSVPVRCRTWKLKIVGVSHCADGLFDIIPDELSSISPGGAVSTNSKRSVVLGGTESTIISSPESERRTTKTRVVPAARRLLVMPTDPTGWQKLLAQSTRQNVKQHNF